MSDIDCSLGDTRTIAVDRIAFDGDTAWTLLTELAQYCRADEFPELLDRPCDTCGGDAWVPLNHQSAVGIVCRGMETFHPERRCGDCGGSGRYVFTIEVERSAPLGIIQRRFHRVSVVPGMVLPIYDWCPDEKPADHICHAWKGGQQSDEWWQHRSFDHTDWTERQIALPPAATPGTWAVLLAVSP